MSQPLDIHSIRQSLQKGESKIILEEDINGEFTVGVINENTSQFNVLTTDNLIDLYILIKKKLISKGNLFEGSGFN